MVWGGEGKGVDVGMGVKEEGKVVLVEEGRKEMEVKRVGGVEEGVEEFGGCGVVMREEGWLVEGMCSEMLGFEGESEVL